MFLSHRRTAFRIDGGGGTILEIIFLFMATAAAVLAVLAVLLPRKRSGDGAKQLGGVHE